MTASEHGDGLGETADIIRGWEAASEIAGRSVASVRKLVDGGRLRAEKSADGVYVFERADLLALPRVLRVAEPETSADTPVEADSASGALSSPQLALPGSRAEAARSDSLDGELAAEMFGLFEAGRAPVEVVVAMKQSPSIVESAYAAWQRMKALDVTSTLAQSRIAVLEGSIAHLDGKLDELVTVVNAHDSVITETSTEVWQQRHSVDGLSSRTAALERRPRSDHAQPELRGLRQRLAAVEQVVRALPAAPMPIGQMCRACGGQVVVPSACSACGAGRAAC